MHADLLADFFNKIGQKRTWRHRFLTSTYRQEADIRIKSEP